MDIFQSIIFGIVEGITEFLPISSTGHLILASDLLKVEQTEFVKTFEIAIQSGAILAVIVLYSKKIKSDFELGKKVLTAFVPSAVIGFLLYKLIKQYLIGNTEVVLGSLFLGGAVLIAVELMFRNKGGKLKTLNTISYEKAFIIGLFQSVAMIPGVSRAAATIIGGLLVGLPRREAVEFSFLLAVPTMLAATTLDLGQTSFSFDMNEWVTLGIGFITAFAVALIAIKWLLNYVRSNNFITFGVYRIALSILYFLFLLK